LPQKEYGILQKEQKHFPWRKNFNDEDETFRERHFLLRWFGRERERERDVFPTGTGFKRITCCLISSPTGNVF
jgi:hypothetical protein